MKKIRIGNGYDVHALAEGLPLRLGGIDIPHHKGAVAHSDGDCLLHALCDALLGSLALGDIGLHFPDTDLRWKGADSCDLLKQCYNMVQEKNFELENADMILCLQAPKVAGYIPQMRARIAEILEVPQDCISVKATTTEHLGFEGKEEGLGAWATVLVAQKE